MRCYTSAINLPTNKAMQNNSIGVRAVPNPRHSQHKANSTEQTISSTTCNWISMGSSYFNRAFYSSQSPAQISFNCVPLEGPNLPTTCAPLAYIIRQAEESLFAKERPLGCKLFQSLTAFFEAQCMLQGVVSTQVQILGIAPQALELDHKIRSEARLLPRIASWVRHKPNATNLNVDGMMCMPKYPQINRFS